MANEYVNWMTLLLRNTLLLRSSTLTQYFYAVLLRGSTLTQHSTLTRQQSYAAALLRGSPYVAALLHSAGIYDVCVLKYFCLLRCHCQMTLLSSAAGSVVCALTET